MKNLLLILLTVVSYSCLGQDHIYEGEYAMPSPQFEANPFFKEVEDAREIIKLINGDTSRIDIYDSLNRKIEVLSFRDGARYDRWFYTFDDDRGYHDYSHEPCDQSKSYYSKTYVIVKVNKWGKYDSILEVITPFRNQVQQEKMLRGTQYKYNSQGQLLEKWHKYHSSFHSEYVYEGKNLKSVFVFNPEGKFGNHYELHYDKAGKVHQVLSLYRSIDWKSVDSSSVENYVYHGDQLSYFNYKSLNPSSSVAELREFWYEYNDLGKLVLIRLKKGDYQHEVIFKYEAGRLVEASCNFEQDVFSIYSMQSGYRGNDGQKHSFLATYKYNEQGDCVAEVKTVDGRTVYSNLRLIKYK